MDHAANPCPAAGCSLQVALTQAAAAAAAAEAAPE